MCFDGFKMLFFDKIEGGNILVYNWLFENFVVEDFSYVFMIILRVEVIILVFIERVK